LYFDWGFDWSSDWRFGWSLLILVVSRGIIYWFLTTTLPGLVLILVDCLTTRIAANPPLPPLSSVGRCVEPTSELSKAFLLPLVPLPPGLDVEEWSFWFEGVVPELGHSQLQQTL
jgi:hypothetical protein